MRLLATLLLLLALAVTGIFIALNTAPGRAFATREINHFAGPNLQITGLAGHFPADIKITALTLSDAQGPYATGAELELRWNPLALLHRELDITALTAGSITLLRQPAPAKPAKPGTQSAPPNVQLNIARLAIAKLQLPPALAGEPITLAATGAVHLKDPTHGAITLAATTPDHTAIYTLAAGIDPQTVALTLHAAEPPNGLLGHFAGPQVHAPLNIDASLNGPRAHAALAFTAALGSARLNGAGTLNLTPATPGADVTLTIPELAPFAALTHQNIAGGTKLHLLIAHNNVQLTGNLNLTAAPSHAAQLIGPNGTFSLLATIAGNTVTLHALTLTGADISASLSGTLDAKNFNLQTALTLNQIATLSPGLSGAVSETGTLIGTPQDFAVDALLAGHIADSKFPSGPFTIHLSAQHLPSAPSGTLTGSGALENSPLLLNAAFTRASSGAATLTITHASWRSLAAQANLALAAGAKIPTGTAIFTLANLSDLAAFSPIPLHGSLDGEFSDLGAEKFKLDLTARNFLANPRLGPINATLHAAGPTRALSVQAQASLKNLFAHPAELAFSGVLDLDHRAATLATLTATWHQLNLRLLGPAQIATQPGLAIHHLAATLNGARLTLDGALTPALNANLAIANLPASLAQPFAPTLNATGTLSATATLTGSLAAPAGKLSLQANAIKLLNGPAAAIPPAYLAAQITTSGQAANISAHLAAGPNISLTAAGLVPEQPSGVLNLHLTGRADLRLLDPILAAQGNIVRGVIAADLRVTGTPKSPLANGAITLADGSVEAIASGLNLTHIAATLSAAGRLVTLQSFSATAGQGAITGHGAISLATPDLPIDLSLAAQNATPISSDLVTETLDAALTLRGALRGPLALAGRVELTGANINIPKSLPPSVANLPIINAGSQPPPPPAPPPPVSLDLRVTAHNRIFVRGDGLFAELGGKLHITGTAAAPDPEGGFTLIRGNFSLAGKTLQFTSGTISFNGAGFMPTLDLEATVTSNSATASLVIGGTAAKPTFTLTSTPPLPSDEILAQLLFHQSAANLTPFQAASLAAALAQLSGAGGGNPLDSVRNALGLDELSLGGSGTGPPSLQAGRYVAPGVYVGATQATNGQGTQATVQINLAKGLQLQTTTGASSASGGNSSSVGLTYQFNY